MKPIEVPQFNPTAAVLPRCPSQTPSARIPCQLKTSQSQRLPEVRRPITNTFAQMRGFVAQSPVWAPSTVLQVG